MTEEGEETEETGMTEMTAGIAGGDVVEVTEEGHGVLTGDGLAVMVEGDPAVDQDREVGEGCDCQSKLSGNGTNFSDTLTKLKACNAAIDTACDGGMDNDTMAKMTGCKEAAEAFRTGFLAMTNADADKMCAMLGDVEALKTAAEAACENVEDVDKAQVDKQKMCKEAFMDCAKARKDSIDIVVKCGSACPVPDANTTQAP